MEANRYSDGNTPVRIEYGRTELVCTAAQLEQTDRLDEPVVRAAEDDTNETDEPFFGSHIRKAIRTIRGS